MKLNTEIRHEFLGFINDFSTRNKRAYYSTIFILNELKERDLEINDEIIIEVLDELEETFDNDCNITQPEIEQEILDELIAKGAK